MTTLLQSTWIRLAITVAVLVYLFRHVDAYEAGRVLVAVCPWALAAVLLLVALDRVVMIWRWVMLLRAAAIDVAFGAAASVFLVSAFMGSFLPSGGGDAARAWILGRRTSQTGVVLASVAVDRLAGVIAITLLGVTGTFLWAREGQLQGPVLALAAVVGAATAAAFWIDRLARAAMPEALRKTRIGDAVQRLAEAVARYRQSPRALAVVLTLSLAVQMLRVLQAYVLGLGLGIAVPFDYYLVFMPIGLLLLLLPVSVSGFGLPQGVIVWLLRPVGVAEETSFALSTLILLSGLAGNLPGLWLYVRGPRSCPARNLTHLR